MSNICAYRTNSETYPKTNSPVKGFDGKLNKFIRRDCFSDLWNTGKYVKSVDFIPVLPRHKFKIATARWFVEELKKWGFKFEELEVEKKLYSRQFGIFNVRHGETSNLRRTLAHLTALRYLDFSENLFHIINDTYKWSVKFPKIDTFLLFQMAHFTYRTKYHFYFNSNHTFLDHSPCSKLCPLKKFWEKLDNEPRGGILSIMDCSDLSREQSESMLELIKQEKLEEVIRDYLSE